MERGKHNKKGCALLAARILLCLGYNASLGCTVGEVDVVGKSGTSGDRCQDRQGHFHLLGTMSLFYLGSSKFLLFVSRVCWYFSSPEVRRYLK